MALKLKNINKSYGDNTVFNNLSLEVQKGEKLCIMGKSGCGKTTLLHIILGIVRPDAGEVLAFSNNISPVFQEDRLCEGFSALENVRAVTGKNVTDTDILHCLNLLGLTDFASLPVRELSGGMRRRVAIARALLSQGDIFLLDEPFKGLDDATREKVINVILSYTQGKTVITATHDKRDAELLGAKIFKM